MHIENSIHGSRHRHFLAAPVFAIALLSVLFVGKIRSEKIRASVVQSSGQLIARGGDAEMSLADGSEAFLYEDASVNQEGSSITLNEGTMLITSTGLLDVWAGDNEFMGFHGGFLLSQSAQGFSLLALTTPVLVRTGNDIFIVSPGMSVTGESTVSLPTGDILSTLVSHVRSLQPIDADIFQDQLHRLQSLPEAPLPPLPESDDEKIPSVLTALSTALEANDTAAAHDAIRTPALQEYLSSTDLPKSILPALLARSAENPSITAQLIPSLTDADLWLLLSFHDQYRIAAMDTSGPVGLPADIRLHRWLQFPAADVLPEGVPALTVERWSTQMQKFLEGDKDAGEVLNSLLEILSPFRQRAVQNGWVERLQQWGNALHQLIDSRQNILSDDARKEYAQWSNLENLTPFPDVLPPAPVILEERPVPQPQSSSSSLAAEPFDAAAVSADAKKILQDIGALFMIQTSIEAKAKDTVIVRNLLFASADGSEHLYHFVLHPSLHSLTQIVRDNQELPYPLTLEKFAEWARGGR